MEFGCWLAALVWASGGDGDVAGAGQQEPAGQREVGGELQQQQQQQWLTAGQVEVAGLLVQGEPRQVHWPIYNKFPPGLYAIYHSDQHNRFLNVKVLVGVFNTEKALVGVFSGFYENFAKIC